MEITPLTLGINSVVKLYPILSGDYHIHRYKIHVLFLLSLSLDNLLVGSI